MTVEIEEQQRAAERILALIKLRAELVVNVRLLFSGVNSLRASATYSRYAA
jgi:hypothetical protein